MRRPRVVDLLWRRLLRDVATTEAGISKVVVIIDGHEHAPVYLKPGERLVVRNNNARGRR